MSSMSKCLSVIAVLFLSAHLAVGQGDTKQFSKEGLVFTYPSSWILEDQTNSDAQQLTLARADSDAQIRVFVFRPAVTTPEKLAEAKRVLVDPYINSTVKQFEAMGAKPDRVEGTTEIAGTIAEGIKVQAVLDREPGAAEIYWGVVGQKLVVLTFFGPDKARKQMETAWNSIRSSLKIEEAKPTAQPNKKP